MDDIYRARLSATPHPPGAHLSNHPVQTSQTAHPTPMQRPDDIHIQPHPFQPAPAGAAGGAMDSHGHGPAHPAHPQPIPIQLPNIYVNPFPAQDTRHDAHAHDAGTRHMREGPTNNGSSPPVNVPTTTSTSTSHRRSSSTIKIGPWRITKPHPLLWVCLVLSLLALVLEVPKGSLPTLTGRHKTLRAQERLLTQRLHLLSHLSHFLPQPLSTLIAPSTPTDPTTSLLALNDRKQLELIQNAGLRFWNSHLGTTTTTTLVGTGAGNDERWWAVEELGEGASLVRSKSEGREREVWVLRMGDTQDRDRPLLNALTHSLLLRDKLQGELQVARSGESDVAHASDGARRSIDTPLSAAAGAGGAGVNKGRDAAREQELRAEQHRLEELRRREREREREVEEREREVARREKWVVDEMRKLSDKVHSQATELTLEDRITERLKSYQRQLAQLHDRDDARGGLGAGTGAGVAAGVAGARTGAGAAGVGAGPGAGPSAGIDVNAGVGAGGRGHAARGEL